MRIEKAKRDRHCGNCGNLIPKGFPYWSFWSICQKCVKNAYVELMEKNKERYEVFSDKTKI